MLFITNEDTSKMGYNLLSGEVIETTGFNSIEEAANATLEACQDSVYYVILENRGMEYADKLFEDFSNEEYRKQYPSTYKALKKAILLQTIFILENGYAKDVSKIDPEIISFSPNALTLLTNAYIYREGY